MTLLDGTKGSDYKVADIYLEMRIKRRLMMLGLTNGTTITVLNKKKNGAVIFKVRGTRFAAGKKIAEGIILGAGSGING